MNQWIKRYCNAHPHSPQRVIDLLRWRLGGGRGDRHKSKTEDTFCRGEFELAPPVSASPMASAQDSIRLTWIGHSTFLLQYLGRNILTDPIFSDCQPLPVSSLRRLRPPGIKLHELPRIDDVLISHSHYDHLDAPSINALGKAVHYWVPAGLSNWFDRRGIQMCSQLNWWESRSLSSDINIHCVPAQHGSGRTPFDRDRTHWCGWILKSSSRTIFFVGDTGYSPSFREIGARFGPIDLAMIPIGAYEPRWLMKSMHLNPADAVQVHLDIKSLLSVACHWGTYRLTDEPVDEPPRLLGRELELRLIDPAQFRIVQPGETLEF